MTRAHEIAREIKAADTWNPEMLRELCEIADMLPEWEAADGESFESVAYAAAEKLGVELI